MNEDKVSAGAAGAGLATVTAEDTVLDVWYPAPALIGVAYPAVDQPDLSAAERTDQIRAVRIVVVQTKIATLAEPATSTADVYLRLHLLSGAIGAPAHHQSGRPSSRCCRTTPGPRWARSRRKQSPRPGCAPLWREFGSPLTASTNFPG